MDNLASLLILASITASVSFTVCVTSVFKWLRTLGTWIHPKLGGFLHCPFCFGTWVTFGVVFLTYGKMTVTIVFSIPVLNFFLNSFAVTGLMAVIHSVILTAYKSVAIANALAKSSKPQ